MTLALDAWKSIGLGYGSGGRFARAAPYLAAATLLLVLLFHLYPEVLFQGRLLDTGDQLLFFYPTHYYLADMARHGQLALWNPYVDAGFPLIADPVAAPFYPLSYLMALFQDPAQGAGVYAVVHLWLGGMGMFAFLRALGCGTIPCLVGAVTWMLGGRSLAFGGQSAAVSWPPLAFLFAELLVRDPRGPYLAGLALVVGLSLLSAPIDVLYPVLVAVAIYGVYRSASSASWRVALRRSWLLVTSLLVGVGLAAVSLLPQVEFALQSNRRALGYDFASSFSIHPLAFITALLPDFFAPGGGPAWGHADSGSVLYSGVVALVLTALALWKRPLPRAGFFALTGLVSALVSLGSYFPLHRLLYDYLPFYSFFRSPSKMVFLLSFSLAVLAGLGAARVLDRAWLDAASGRRSFLAFGTALVLLSGAALLLTAVEHDRATALVGAYWQRKLSSDPANAHALFFSQNPGILLDAEVGLLKRTWGLAAAALLVLAMRLRLSLDPRVVSIAILALVLWDLVVFAQPRTSASPEQVLEWYHGAPTAAWLRSQTEPGRFLNLDALDVRRFTFYSDFDESAYRTAMALIPPNAALVHRLEDVGEGPTAYTQRYGDFMRAVDDRWDHEMDPSSRLLALLNVRHILTERDLPASQFRLEFQSGTAKVYRNLLALPRAFLVGRAEVQESGQLALSRLFDPSFDPGNMAIVEGRPEAVAAMTAPVDGSASVVLHEPDRVEVLTRASGPSLLVLGDAYYPGWKAYVDGVETEILRTDYLLRGVALAGGDHRVTFQYDPWSVKLGAGLSAFAALACGGLAVRRWRPGKRLGEEDPWPR